MEISSENALAVADQLPTEDGFWAWAATVPVASRDTAFGTITPWGTQRELIRQVFEGLNRGIHQFVVLKAGQVGASLIMQLLTLYWYRHSPGLQGVCVADCDEVREYFRDTFTQMAEEADAENTPRLNNKNQIAWENGSRLLFQTSGRRTGARLGVGRGVAFVHGTEVGLWQNPQALTILRTRVSDKHPHRLSVYESTARGKNWWYDLWTDAEDAVDIHRIFLGWWLREDYTLSPDSPEFARYWDGRLTLRERQWTEALKRRYRVELTPEQWAWRRWYVMEKAGGDTRLADQEEPTLPEDAFEATGRSFLGTECVARCRKSLKSAPKPKLYRYEFGARIEECTVKETNAANADLLVWEMPTPGDAYVIAAVPAHSAEPTCPTSALSIWKATRDNLIQVAAFASQTCGLQTFSWVIVHLLSAYHVQRRAFILEVAGVGAGTLQELNRIQDSGWGTQHGQSVRTLLGPIRHYLWRRPDSMGGSLARQWKSTGELQTWLLRRLKDQVDNGSVVVRDAALISEYERMRQVDDRFESEGRTLEEHRLMCSALAVESWASQLRPLFRRVQGSSAPTQTVTDRMMQRFFDRLGVKAVAP